MIDNIIIAGKNSIAVEITKYILDKYPNVCVYAIFNSNDHGIDSPWQLSFKKYCLSNDKIKPIKLIDSYSISNAIFLSLEFDRIISPLRFSAKHLFNIHFSLLPQYRGVYTSALPLLHGEPYSGVTLHIIDSGIDSGPIITQKKIKLSKIYNAGQLYSIYIYEAIKLVKGELWSLFNTTYQSAQQNTESSSYFSRKSINYQETELDLNTKADTLVRQVKSMSFRQFQLPQCNGYNISLVQLTKLKSSSKVPTVVEDADKYLVVDTLDYRVNLIKDNLEKLLESIQNNNITECKDIIELDTSLLFELDNHGNSVFSCALNTMNDELFVYLLTKALSYEFFYCFQRSINQLIFDYVKLSGRASVITIYENVLAGNPFNKGNEL